MALFAILGAVNALELPFACAEQTDRPALNVSEPSSVRTASHRRWPSDSKEFIVSANGVVAVNDRPKKSFVAGNRMDPRQSDNLAFVASNAQVRFGDTDKGKQTISVPECGPSPLTPDQIKSLVNEAARRHEVDALFATAIIWAESQFDRNRNSDKGARGPMQLMPGTAERFGVRDVCDPESNIEGGVKYLRVLLDEFQNPLLVAAAYNAGEDRIYEYGGVPPFKETIRYVAKVVNYQLGLPVPGPKKVPVGVGRIPVPVKTSGAESGIIPIKKTGTFVGGVMHF